jgi:Molybdopterin-binding domain of aldehyde dehydrogenase
MLARHGNHPVEVVAEVIPDLNEDEFSAHSFGAIYVEVAVDPDLGMVRVRHVVAVYDAGKIINEKLAKSQFVGGIVWGISLALLEDTEVDPRSGRIVNANLADYHLPVNADIGAIDVSALDIPDFKVDILGAARHRRNRYYRHRRRCRERDFPRDRKAHTRSFRSPKRNSDSRQAFEYTSPAPAQDMLLRHPSFLPSSMTDVERRCWR